MKQGNRCVWFTEETSVRNLAWLPFKFCSIFQLIQSNSLLSWTILKSGGSTSPMRHVLKGLSHQLDTGSITGMVDQAGIPQQADFQYFPTLSWLLIQLSYSPPSDVENACGFISKLSAEWRFAFAGGLEYVSSLLCVTMLWWHFQGF
jgi:hypothetical protein